MKSILLQWAVSHIHLLIFSHENFNTPEGGRVKDIIERLTHKDPDQRISHKDAMGLLVCVGDEIKFKTKEAEYKIRDAREGWGKEVAKESKSSKRSGRGTSSIFRRIGANKKTAIASKKRSGSNKKDSDVTAKPSEKKPEKTVRLDFEEEQSQSRHNSPRSRNN